MKFKLEIKLGNDAVQTWCDVADCLRSVANTLAQGGGTDPVRTNMGFIDDLNGNRVGAWEVNKGE